MFTVSLLVKGFVLVIVTPTSLAVTDLLLRYSGQPGISNQALFSFILSPLGLMLGSWLLASYLFGFFLEQAAIQSLLMQHDAGHRSISYAIWTCVNKAIPLGKLALLQAACLSLFAVLALYIGRWLFGLFLAHWDINYYWQQQRTSVWLYFAGLSALLLPPAIWLGRLWLNWWFALPLALIHTQGFYRQLSVSTSLSQGHLLQICMSLILWLGTRLLAFTIVLVVAISGSEPIFDFAYHNLALYVGLVVGVAAMLFMSFFDRFIYSGLQYYLFRRAWLTHRVSEPHGERHLQHKDQRLAKPLRWLLVTTTLVAGAWIYDDLLLIADRFQQPHQMQVMAHRGGGKYADENSLPGLDYAIASGADYSEIDIQLTADDRLFVGHDRDIGRTTGLDLVVEKSSYAELEQAYLDAGRQPTRLEDWLDAAQGKIGLNIEVKRYRGGGDILAAMRAALHDYSGEVILTSLDEGLLMRMRQVFPTMPIGMIVAASVGESALYDSIDMIFMSEQWITPLRVLRAQQRGKSVWVWTVDQPDAIRRLFYLGVDGVITDKPGEVLALINYEQSLDPVERFISGLRYWLQSSLAM